MRLPPRGALEPTGSFDAIELYDRFGVGWILRRRLSWVAAQIDDSTAPIERILEVGYGSGVFQYELASRARVSVGVDLHPYASRVGRRLSQDAVVSHLIRGDAARLPFVEGCFDRVIFVSVLEFVTDPGSCLREGRRLLAPEGRLLLLTPRRLWWADLLWNALSGWNARADFRSGRERVRQAIEAELTGARRLPHPVWLPRVLAPYEIVVWDRPAAVVEARSLTTRGGPRALDSFSG